MTDQLAEWYEHNRSRLEARAIKVVFERSPRDARGKRSAWLIVQDDITGGQVTVWDTGECQLVRPDHVNAVEDLALHEPDDLLPVLVQLEAVFD
jgi:hypothetical protein